MAFRYSIIYKGHKYTYRCTPKLWLKDMYLEELIAIDDTNTLTILGA